MLRTAGLIGGLVLLTGAAAPSPELQKAFAGTIVVTYPDGRSMEVWMNPDGTYTSEGRRHGHYKGRWTLKGDQVCFHRSLGGYCTPMPAEGSTFTAKALSGETVQVRLKPGRAGAG